jgi:hypothetical protein
VPGPGRTIFQAAFANLNPRAANKVDFHIRDRAPLLVIGNGPAPHGSGLRLQGGGQAPGHVGGRGGLRGTYNIGVVCAKVGGVAGTTRVSFDPESLLRSLMENVPGAVDRCEVDEDWAMLGMGDDIETISGYPAGEFVRSARRSSRKGQSRCRRSRSCRRT